MASAIERNAVHCLKSLRRPTLPLPISKRLTLQNAAPTTTSAKAIVNPFLPRYNAKSKRWSPPRYSLRQQADIVKAMKAAEAITGKPLTSLLPPGPKFPRVAAKTSPAASAALLAPVEWLGKAPEPKVPSANVYGLYANRKRMFKGHKWERTKLSTQIKRSVVMKDMARRVRRYKSFYRRRKPNPLKPARSAKAQKLPF
ncbi:hypothetical protein BDV98DRAFT_567278 [Pterulicium gracile]|uniref:Large ribosomal subunit protein mL59 domain-containing protein n=1 Tax=Pterulicium gracile TaxID=1884261 RepID=A0A5C3QHU0_9AGAR|nr:hypothetical protein BDV98DRAFT_567278 [Pterula gracilis]